MKVTASLPHTTHLTKYTPETLKRGTKVFVRSRDLSATVTLVYKLGCCVVTGITVEYDDGELQYFPINEIVLDIEL